MVRRRFSEITTRRLGTRGQSKYHYYGLGVRRTSKYYDPEANGCHSTFPGIDYQIENQYSGQLPSFSVFKSKTPPLDPAMTEVSRPNKRPKIDEQREKEYQISEPCQEESVNEKDLLVTKQTSEAKLEKAFSALRTFPSSFDLFVPAGISYDHLDTFLLMYKTHCHRMIDAVICSDFEAVQVYLNHFYGELPAHLTSLLEHDFLSRVIEVCDVLFYEVSTATALV